MWFYNSQKKTQMIKTSIKTGMKIEAVILNTFAPQINQMLKAGQHLELEGIGKVQLLYITDLSVRVLEIWNQCLTFIKM